MNTEATHEPNAAQTTGERLRIAREKLGLTQQAVAERLCLKVSTVRDIEDNKLSDDLASTFLRGYIRSYARLVHIPEEELLPMMAKQAPVKATKIEPMQGFALGKRRKKRDGWLMTFTWLVLFVVVGLTGAWWWQNHKAQQEEITTMADQSSAELSGDHNDIGQSVPLNIDSGSTPPESSHTPDTSANMLHATQAEGGHDVAIQTMTTAPEPYIPPIAQVTPVPGGMPTSVTTAVSEAEDSEPLVMNFNADCWLEVTDATGKKLFSGMQRKETHLNLAGKAPYKLKIGAPAAVQIQFQGKPVDLSRFIRTNQVARLTLNAE